MTLALYDPQTKKPRLFKPIDPKNISIYVCGPTTYDRAHLGHARSVLVMDTLYRVLVYEYGPVVRLAMSVTDINEKILAASKKQLTDWRLLGRTYATMYEQDMQRLGVNLSGHLMFATDYIKEMIDYVAALLDKGRAYIGKEGVWFDVRQDPEYGSLANRKHEDQIANDQSDEALSEDKRYHADFALWKFADKDEPDSFESPWGYGRPGWHIECSAMIKARLGRTIDVHMGGNDLKYPHHENECAQSRALHNAPLANYWVHNGMVLYNNKKMSKSGSCVYLSDVLADYDYKAVRLMLLGTHYRSNLNFTYKRLDEAKKTLDLWFAAMQVLYKAENKLASYDDDDRVAMTAPLHNDLNTPLFISSLTARAKLVLDRAKDNLPGYIDVAQHKAASQLRHGAWFLGIALV